MAETPVSQVASTVKENNPIHVEFLDETRPAVLSTEVALRFQKKHQHILRDIDRLCSILPKSFRESNFGRTLLDVPGPNGAVRQSPAYLLTRDAFSLLVMGFTGSAAVRWKLKYIEAFNSLEAAALENRAASLVEAARKQGYDEGKASVLPDMKAAEEAARSEAAQLAFTFTPARRAMLYKAARYAGMGLSNREIAKLLGLTHTTVNTLIRQGRVLGLAPERKPLPAQGGQPGVKR